MHTSDLYNESRAIEYYEELYAKGYMDTWAQDKQARVFEVIQSLGLPGKGEALDYGCGTGVFTGVLKRALPSGWTVYGADISRNALNTARDRYPDCTFFNLGEAGASDKKFDFLLTHHVLEHVQDLRRALDCLCESLKPTASMLHILPCGNEGSLEHAICQLRKGGIEDHLQNRFFFEDMGHVRRLTTQQLGSLLNERRCTLAQEFYSNHYYGAIDWITQYSCDFIRMLTDPSRAIDAQAEKKLLRLQRKLLRLKKMRSSDMGMKQRLANKNKTAKNWLGIFYRWPWYVLSRIANGYITRRAQAEWKNKSGAPNGSEMYLYFKRPSRQA